MYHLITYFYIFAHDMIKLFEINSNNIESRINFFMKIYFNLHLQLSALHLRLMIA